MAKEENSSCQLHLGRGSGVIIRTESMPFNGRGSVISEAVSFSDHRSIQFQPAEAGTG